MRPSSMDLHFALSFTVHLTQMFVVSFREPLLSNDGGMRLFTEALLSSKWLTMRGTQRESHMSKRPWCHMQEDG